MADCIEWDGPVNKDTGYPTAGGRAVHRVALALKLRRPVRKGWMACHTCDNRRCINPDHLYEGTQADNVRDMHDRGRARHLVGDEHPSTRYPDDVIREMRAEHREGVTVRHLADKHGMDYANAWRIVNYKSRVAAGG